jgi:hypothetical protein
MLVFKIQLMAQGIFTLSNAQMVNLLAGEATRNTPFVNMQTIGHMMRILCTNVYGPQVMEEKSRLLIDLKNLKDDTCNLQWIMAGDLNIITTLAEKKGGTRKVDKDVEELATFIDTMELVDTRTNNCQFTWKNKRLGHHQIAKRLDKFLVSESIILQGLNLDCNILPWG